MGGTTGPDLCAAVSNAGGIGTLGAIGLSPKGLRKTIRETRALLSPGKPMGVDLLFPKVGAGARATNKDYTGGLLGEFVQVMVDEKIELFVCAVGVPPKWAVDRLHAAGIIVANMVGSPKHVKHCLAVGVDMIIAQGTEAGAHTGDISSLVLLPQVVDACKGTSTLVVGAGGIFDGRGVLACMALGADGVWCGSRFLVTPEANVPIEYKDRILAATSDDTIRSEIYTGRPLRVLKNPYVMEWEGERKAEARKLLRSGTIPLYADAKAGRIPSNSSAVPSHVLPKQKRKSVFMSNFGFQRNTK